MTAEQDEQEEDRYYFFRHSTRWLKGVTQDLNHSAYFVNRTAFPRTDKQRARSALFFFGPPGSSTVWHEHSNAYRTLLYGATRWFMTPVGGAGYVATSCSTS